MVLSPARSLLAMAIAATLLAAPALAQSTWNRPPDRLQLDGGYFRIDASTVLRFDGGEGTSGAVDFEKDLGLAPDADTFWLDATLRLGRRHQLKVSYTGLLRERTGFDIERDFTWGGETYRVGLTADTSTGTDILGGYYRFALVRTDRFEVGPTVGAGYLWLSARVRAIGTGTGPGGGSVSRTLDERAEVGSFTGAVGGYAALWPAERLSLHGDVLSIHLKPGDWEAEVTDWRVGATVHVLRNLGLSAQYKHYTFRYDQGLVVQQLGGTITYEGFQAYLSLLF
jgi:hypothetical protein